MNYEQVFLEQLNVVESVIRQIARRNGLFDDDAEEFRSHVFVKLIENDYRVLRQWEQRSQLRTFLAVVFQRVLQDYRNQLWGKWRPSAEAKRLGSVAMLLERLLTRDKLTLDEAVATLQTAHRVTESAESLRALASRFPTRVNRHDGEEVGEHVPDPSPLPDAAAERMRAAGGAERIRVALNRAMDALPAEDRLIIKLAFWDAVPIADIARMLGLVQKRLYRRIETTLARLRVLLESDPDSAGARDLLEHEWSDFVRPVALAVTPSRAPTGNSPAGSVFTRVEP